MDGETLLKMDSNMLVSIINLKLRDYYSTLEILCDDMDVSRVELESKLNKAGFEYKSDINQFK